MKKHLLTLAFGAVCIGACAQGKINFVNDSLHLVYFSGYLLGADGSLQQGQPVPNGPLPSGITLIAGMYAGTSSTSLSLYSTASFASGSGPGMFGSVAVNLISPFISGGTTAYIQVAVWDQAYATPGMAQAWGSYAGSSSIFTTVASGTVLYNSIVNHNSPANSTWADGAFNMDQYAVGARGAIAIGLIPEPSSLALAGVGLASLLIFRRRK